MSRKRPSGVAALVLFCGLHCATDAAAAPPPEIGPLEDASRLDLPMATRDAEATRAEIVSLASDAASAFVVASIAVHFDRARRQYELHHAGMTEGPLLDPATDEERRWIEVAMYHCDTAAPRYAKPFLMLELLRIEREFGIPDELRGVTLATWCGEAAYQVGDIVGDGGAAVGIFQLHPPITRLCGSPDLRHDPIASAHCWLWNLERVYAKARRRCPTKHAWAAAELWLSQGGLKSNYSCTRVSGHVARLRVWQRLLARDERLAAADATPAFTVH